jgi:hypothetical protein
LNVTASPETLSPPDHQYVNVTTSVTVMDNADPQPTVSQIMVLSNQPDSGQGEGDQPLDIVITDDNTFQLRAERGSSGADRVYTIYYQATDGCGNSTVASAEVTVPAE